MHVVDAVPERLSHGGGDARDGSQPFADVVEYLLAAAVLHGELHVEFGTIDRLGVFVQLSATRAPCSARHFGNLHQLALYQIAQFVAYIQRNSRCRNCGNHRRTLVEIGQEAASHREKQHENSDEQSDRERNHRFLMLKHPSKHLGITFGQPLGQTAVFFVLR